MHSARNETSGSIARLTSARALRRRRRRPRGGKRSLPAAGRSPSARSVITSPDTPPRRLANDSRRLPSQDVWSHGGGAPPPAHPLGNAPSQGLNWPPELPKWWSEDSKQRTRNRQIYHGLRLASPAVMKRLIAEALQAAAEPNALALARRFPFLDRQKIYCATAPNHRAVYQSTDVFPAFRAVHIRVWF